MFRMFDIVVVEKSSYPTGSLVKECREDSLPVRRIGLN
jgi:hypothetical protein